MTMPIVEADPWRTQYFASIFCPDNVVVPTDDELAYQLYPKYRWIYNKLLICETQGLENAPHDIMPRHFPVFSKPIYNLRGMGSGGKIIESPEQFRSEAQPAHMWMSLLTGEHVSTDAAVIDGEAVWWRHTVGKALGQGMFDYWVILGESRPEIERYCGEWLRFHLKGYTGCVNFETIGGKIIEGHLRFADQWPDLYGPGWIEAVVELYAYAHWRFRDEARCTGYSVVLYGGHGTQYKKPDQHAVNEFLQRPGISSIQITFHDDRPPETHAMPPGGFRLAIVNCWHLEAGFEVREQLARMFRSTQPPTRAAA
ncbi:MAG TPA: hypothetical protein VGR30_11570 [Candidatus Binatia bacterium]|jgi:hypothetical protein|nr:hypothetical protein [Candidatus Binatia bacterium]